MSIDVLHEKIRKLKNPLVIDFAVKESLIPSRLISGQV